MKRLLISIFLTTSAVSLSGQDFIRWSLGSSLDKSSTFVQSISLDLNRTEAKSEKEGFYFFYGPKGYILPVVDFNIGDGVASANNNVSAQIRFGKNFFLEKSKDTHLFFNVAPTYNADRVFDEELLYTDFDFGVNHVKSKDKVIEVNNESVPFIYRVTSISGGVSNNLGYRWSEFNDDSGAYARTGLFVNLKIRMRRNNFTSLSSTGKGKDIAEYKHWDNIVLNISSVYYAIHSELEALTTNSSVGSLNISLDKYLSHKLSLNMAYIYSEDNPKYSEVHTLTFGLKMKF